MAWIYSVATRDFSKFSKKKKKLPFFCVADYETMTVEMDARYTTRGCRCAVSWAYKGEDCETQCCDFGDEKGAWCAIEDPIECRATKGSPQVRTYGLCV